jgi:hypothetical protein
MLSLKSFFCSKVNSGKRSSSDLLLTGLFRFSPDDFEGREYFEEDFSFVPTAGLVIFDEFDRDICRSAFRFFEDFIDASCWETMAKCRSNSAI